jgi:hypothetical protein
MALERVWAVAISSALVGAGVGVNTIDVTLSTLAFFARSPASASRVVPRLTEQATAIAIEG